MNKKMSIMAIALFSSVGMNGMDLNRIVHQVQNTGVVAADCLESAVDRPCLNKFVNSVCDTAARMPNVTRGCVTINDQHNIAKKYRDQFVPTENVSENATMAFLVNPKLNEFNQQYNDINFRRSKVAALLTFVNGLGFAASLKYSDSSVVKATTGTSFVASLLSFFGFTYLAKRDVVAVIEGVERKLSAVTGENSGNEYAATSQEEYDQLQAAQRASLEDTNPSAI